MKIFYILALICLLFVLVPPASAVAQIAWTKTIGYCVTAIDINQAGTLILVGLGNGSIFAYDTTGNITWTNSTNATAGSRAIKKIAADSSGNIAWANMAGENGYIAYTGISAGKVSPGTNVTDVAIMSDGSRYATTELSPPSLKIHYPNGSDFVYNTTFTGATWSKIGYDPSGAWVVTASQSSNVLYFWNLTTWTGWEEFNPAHTPVKTPDQINIDTFPYRQNISVEGSGSKGLTFHQTTNVTYIQKLNNSYYEYNPANTGNYFYWTRPGYVADTQSTLLNLSWINTSNSNYYVVLKPGYTNYTIYYGKTYTNSIINYDYRTNGTIINAMFNSSGTWTAPSTVISISNLTIVGSGGFGGNGGFAVPMISKNGGGGFGGNSGQIVYNSSIISVTPGNGYTITIGSSGFNSSAFGSTALYGVNGMNGCDACNNGTTPTAGMNGFLYIPLIFSSTGGSNECGSPPGENNASGYGSGGGGGRGGTYCYVVDHYHTLGGAGGSGAPGIVNFTFNTVEMESYYYGTTPTASYNFTIQSQQSASTLSQPSSKAYAGNILGISVPATGTLASIITDTIFYQQYISSMGFGTTYNATLSSGYAALFAGVPYTVSASNSGAASIEGRGAYGNIYDAGGVAKASALTGGTIRSADVAMSSGIFAAFGGDEGKLYMLSREGSSNWYSYFTGTADTPINAVAVAWDGSSVSVGRFGGTLEYYITNVTIPVTPTPAPNVEATVYAFKDGAAYQSQLITIYSSASAPSSWIPETSLYTDGLGKITYTTTPGTYYKFVVNNVVGTESGEAEEIWQSNAASTTIYIYSLSSITPYEWNAYYVTSTNNVTVVYTDSIPATNVMVTIRDLKTNLDVMTRSYSSTSAFTLEYHDVSGTGSYQVSVVINRMGVSIRDQRMVTSPNTYGITFPIDNYIKWAISTLAIMIIAGLFGYSNSKRGALALVVFTVVLMLFDMLPWSMSVIVSLAAILAVMSLFSSRVQ